MRGMVLVSSCLIGVPCAYDGKHRLNHDLIRKLLKFDAIISLCPEILSGFSIPRPRIEISNGDGKDVIKGKAKIIDEYGKDHTSTVLEGIQKAMEIILKNNICIAFLKEKSPMCGVNQIYDGSFKGHLIEGCGVLTAFLLKKGIKCIPV